MGSSPTNLTLPSSHLNFYPDLIKVGNNIVGSSEVEVELEGKERKAKAE